MRYLITNKKAYFNYFIIEEFEAGLCLAGTEVKSCRKKGCSFSDSFIGFDKGEAVLYGFHIKPYENGNIWNLDADRAKKLLLHKYELRKLMQKSKENGMSIVPLSVYINDDHRIKVKIALAKGKKLYDKRRVLAEKDEKRKIERSFD